MSIYTKTSSAIVKSTWQSAETTKGIMEGLSVHISLNNDLLDDGHPDEILGLDLARDRQAMACHSRAGSPACAACFSVETIVKALEA